MHLGLNIDHIAALREARKINDPNPLEAVFIAKNSGVHQITLHLREDRRHICDDDVCMILKASPLPVNVECACDEQIIDFLCKEKPFKITLVPEKRQEITTEGGLNLKQRNLKEIIAIFHKHEIQTSLFIDANIENILLSKDLGVDGIELHTGEYANLYAMLYSNLSRHRNSIKALEQSRKELNERLKKSLEELKKCVSLSQKEKLKVFAGHGLNYANVVEIAKIHGIEELNIGQSIIAKAVFVGLQRAIQDMLELLV